MSRVLLAGAAGQLGSAIARAFGDREIVAHTRATLDVTDAGAVQRAVAEAAPSVVVNCTAFNDVDAAEDRPADAFAINALAVRSLARAAEDSGAALVHFGTDFVFDGEASEPYREEAAPAPRSTYAMSKLVGEWFALDHPRAYVLRVESLFGMPYRWQGRRGTLDTIVCRDRAGPAGEGLHRPRGVAQLRDRRRVGHAPPAGYRRAAGTLSLRQFGPRDLARRGGGNRTAPRPRTAARADHDERAAAEGAAPPLLCARQSQAGRHRLPHASLAGRAWRDGSRLGIRDSGFGIRGSGVGTRDFN